MDAVLASLLHTDDRPPSAAELARLVDYLSSLRAPAGRTRRKQPGRVHHFQVVTERDERTTYSPAVEGRSWYVGVSLGTVSDQPVTLLYKIKDDPRGWTPPTDGLVIPAGFPFAERTLFDRDEPLPTLLALAPVFGAPTTTRDHFSLVPGSARPAHFRTQEMWAFDLYQASVVLSASLNAALPIGSDLPIGGSFWQVTRRMRAHIHFVPRLDELVAGMIEVARLYLLRDPQAPGGARDDTLVVQQRLYWSLLSAQVSLTSLDVVWGPGEPAVVETTTGTKVISWTG